MIKRELVDLLVCPENRMKLALADASMIKALNALIKKGQVANQAGQRVSLPLDGGLVREDGVVLYPIVDDIPIMLKDEAIPLDQMNSV